ncbi:hypothetical protein HDV05_001357 [Chytridiales sp. JEL 0842]|nr:hypothetical protein HDV05_001357 [Chytridiales sp. JEL 0842]
MPGHPNDKVEVNNDTKTPTPHRSLRIDLPRSIKDIPLENIKSLFSAESQHIRDFRVAHTLKKDTFIYVNLKPDAPQGLEGRYRGKEMSVSYKGEKHAVFVFDEREMGVKIGIDDRLVRAFSEKEIRIALLNTYPAACDSAIRRWSYANDMDSTTPYVFVNFRSPMDCEAARNRGRVRLLLPTGSQKIPEGVDLEVVALPKFELGERWERADRKRKGRGGSSSGSGSQSSERAVEDVSASAVAKPVSENTWSAIAKKSVPSTTTAPLAPALVKNQTASPTNTTSKPSLPPKPSEAVAVAASAKPSSPPATFQNPELPTETPIVATSAPAAKEPRSWAAAVSTTTTTTTTKPPSPNTSTTSNVAPNAAPDTKPATPSSKPAQPNPNSTEPRTPPPISAVGYAAAAAKVPDHPPPKSTLASKIAPVVVVVAAKHREQALEDVEDRDGSPGRKNRRRKNRKRKSGSLGGGVGGGEGAGVDGGLEKDGGEKDGGVGGEENVGDVCLGVGGGGQEVGGEVEVDFGGAADLDVQVEDETVLEASEERVVKEEHGVAEEKVEEGKEEHGVAREEVEEVLEKADKEEIVAKDIATIEEQDEIAEKEDGKGIVEKEQTQVETEDVVEEEQPPEAAPTNPPPPVSASSNAALRVNAAEFIPSQEWYAPSDATTLMYPHPPPQPPPAHAHHSHHHLPHHAMYQPGPPPHGYPLMYHGPPPPGPVAPTGYVLPVPAPYGVQAAPGSVEGDVEVNHDADSSSFESVSDAAVESRTRVLVTEESTSSTPNSQYTHAQDRDHHPHSTRTHHHVPHFHPYHMPPSSHGHQPGVHHSMQPHHVPHVHVPPPPHHPHAPPPPPHPTPPHHHPHHSPYYSAPPAGPNGYTHAPPPATFNTTAPAAGPAVETTAVSNPPTPADFSTTVYETWIPRTLATPQVLTDLEQVLERLHGLRVSSVCFACGGDSEHQDEDEFQKIWISVVEGPLVPFLQKQEEEKKAAEEFKVLFGGETLGFLKRDRVDPQKVAEDNADQILHADLCGEWAAAAAADENVVSALKLLFPPGSCLDARLVSNKVSTKAESRNWKVALRFKSGSEAEKWVRKDAGRLVVGGVVGTLVLKREYKDGGGGIRREDGVAFEVGGGQALVVEEEKEQEEKGGVGKLGWASAPFQKMAWAQVVNGGKTGTKQVVQTTLVSRGLELGERSVGGGGGGRRREGVSKKEE